MDAILAAGFPGSTLTSSRFVLPGAGFSGESLARLGGLQNFAGQGQSLAALHQTWMARSLSDMMRLMPIWLPTS